MNNAVTSKIIGLIKQADVLATLILKPKFQKLIFIFSISLCLGCSNSVSKDLDPDTLKTLKKFQKAIAGHPIKNSQNWTVESNFKRLYSFLDSSTKEETFALFKNKKIQRIEVDDAKCILIKIRPKYDNSLIKAEWEELYVAYYDDCDCVCHRRINDSFVPQKQIFKIDTRWYKVIAKGKRYIGG